MTTPAEHLAPPREQSSARLASIAGRVLQRGFAWPAEAKALAASVLTQREAYDAPSVTPLASPTARFDGWDEETEHGFHSL